MARAGYRANDPDRCYFCKAEVLDTITALAHEDGFDMVATGTNADDAADRFRPGIRAGRERGIRTPLLGAGLTKGDVRRLSRYWSLPTWNVGLQRAEQQRAFGIALLPIGGDRLSAGVSRWSV
ncbi:hypothetical protein ACIQI8_42640 [Streptomyces sp. NPDC092369]|uniref:hypothetical protein n=1 Tax=Streptomyces sp. NPDC092369 TaxID=3366015 RepID=UPI00381F4357